MYVAESLKNSKRQVIFCSRCFKLFFYHLKYIYLYDVTLLPYLVSHLMNSLRPLSYPHKNQQPINFVLFRCNEIIENFCMRQMDKIVLAYE